MLLADLSPMQVTSEFPLTVVRRETPNSHDQFRNARQADKATVQLAANSNDPAIRRLVIDLLNELQPEVNACHQSEEGQKLLQEIKEKNRTRAITLAERKRISRAEIECEVCVSLFGSEDEQHTCSVCGTLAHLPCLGLGEEITDKDNVIYLQCQNEGNNTEGRKSTLRSARHKDVEDDDTDLPEDDGVPLETEDETHDSDYDDDLEKKSESETDDEGGTSDCEDAIPQQARFATQQAKEEMLEAQDEAMFIKSEELADFVSREQPSDETRHMTALLSLPPGKVWTEDDLDDEANVKVGLHLLYNKIQGKHSLHFGKSIHIKYKAFPSDVQESMLSERKVSNRQVKAAKKILRPS